MVRNLAVASLDEARIGLEDGELVERFCVGDGRLYCATSAAAVVCVSEQDGRVRSPRAVEAAFM
jgi:hypothetical protein